MSGSILTIPTRSEKENIGQMIHQDLAYPKGFQILIFDDNTPNGAAQIIEESLYNCTAPSLSSSVQSTPSIVLGRCEYYILQREMFFPRNMLLLIFWILSSASLFSQETIQTNSYNQGIHLYNNSHEFNAKVLNLRADQNAKRRSNYIWEEFKEHIAPMGGYRWGSSIIHNGDSVSIQSFELGVGLVTGEINEWDSWGPLILGWDWKQYTLPYLTLEYRWFRRYSLPTSVGNNEKLNPIMLNLGVSGARGGILTLMPVPFAIEGMAGLSTDFKDLYFRGRLGWNLVWFSLGVGGYFSLTQSATTLNNPHYMYLELSFNIWRDNWY